MAHDFNNILAGIYGSSELLKLRNSDPRVLQCADRILHCGDQARKIIDGLLRFSRQSSSTAESDDAHESIKSAMELLKSVGARSVETRLDLQANDAHLRGFVVEAEDIHKVGLFVSPYDGHVNESA